MTPELKRQIPPLYTAENDADPVVYTKFFTPWASWTWYVLEFDGTDTCFGWVEGLEKELGYFSISELQGIEGPFRLRVERDLSFTPCPLSKITGRKRE